ncbi:hypothetical protein MOV61_00220 [Neorhizobium sp. BETTINA12A]|uniref:hypothetical protein n=1 Tax=Neorhizobium sp. BETTINA12A TaxID=2908924 RepID=UPI001FF0DF6D|nr:hypothetical protein [Neorhizobium sp. BETTINA12A]MCJ9749137.1 hypothetical protein [Neorhizobium sp. BETTINA12A]
MKQHAGIDVPLEYSSVCVVDADGRIVREAKVLSEPDALIAWFANHGVAMERIGLEAGPLSQWLHAGMAKGSGGRTDRDTTRACGLQDDTCEDRQEGCTGHRAVDAAWLVQIGPLQICSGLGGACPADRPHAHPGQAPRHRDEHPGHSARLWPQAGPATRRTYAARIRELIEGHPTLEAIAASLLKVRDALADEFAGLSASCVPSPVKTITHGG